MRRTGPVMFVLTAALLLAGCSGLSKGSPSADPAGSRTTAQSSAANSASTGGPAAAANAGAAPVAKTAKPKPNPCRTNKHAQLVLVSITQQRLWMCARTTVVKETAVTTGASAIAYDSTPKGTFHIQGRNRNSVLTLNTGKQYNVKYWIPFSAPLYGFHDSSWQTFPYGSAKYRTQGSHGCVHMPLKAIAFLYSWAHIGATVTIRA
jgi:lipoprotein-anchoring transpeptidase ErfK/SrfK